jgi:hypothetical protein
MASRFYEKRRLWPASLFEENARPNFEWTSIQEPPESLRVISVGVVSCLSEKIMSRSLAKNLLRLPRVELHIFTLRRIDRNHLYAFQCALLLRQVGAR